MLVTLARSNAHTRKPFEGVAAFYRALQRGRERRGRQPDLLRLEQPVESVRAAGRIPATCSSIPLGPLLLKDFGDHTLFSSGDHHEHKLASIERILQTYPAAAFRADRRQRRAGPGDLQRGGARHPQRVRAIYIRSVDRDPSRVGRRSNAWSSRRAPAARSWCSSPDSEFAAAHAAGEGLIRAPTLRSVRADSEQDRQAELPAPPQDPQSGAA